MVDANAQQDNALVARAAAGDSGAFAELVRRHQNRVFGFILRMIDSRDEAMDLTQEVFMKAWQTLPDWRPDARLSTWLLQIARNAAIDTLRRRRIVEFAPLDDGLEIADSAPGPEALYAARQRHVRLEQALQRLPVEQREILLLREIEALSYTDIAHALGIREGTVKSRLARARTALIERFQRKTGDKHG